MNDEPDEEMPDEEMPDEERCPTCKAASGVCGPPDSPWCPDKWHR